MELGFLHIVSAVGGLAAGAVIVALSARTRIAAARSEGRSEIEIARAALQGQFDERNRQLGDFKSRLDAANARVDGLLEELAQLREANGRAVADLENERKQSAEKLALLSAAKEDLSNQFKALASEILEEKSKKFTEQNQANLDVLLSPLKERLTSFQKKVEDVYFSESKERTTLIEQVKALTGLNSTLQEETRNLTLALKGDRKTQGNYGELLLEDVLERAGLREGQHYFRQGAVKSEDGASHVIPDVVIRLPGDRNLVVDSKMSLPDYRMFADSQADAERDAALKRHLQSIRSHIKGLSEKNYQSLYGLRSLDFVVMFVPLEPAFMVAITNDSELFHHAWEKNVLLVSPSTLLFVVRTVANLWRQEDLGRNAREISSRGAELYDKLVGFVADLQKVGERIQQAQDSYHEARKKLSEGTGNLVRQAEMLKKLGVKPAKSLPPQWVDEPKVDA